MRFFCCRIETSSERGDLPGEDNSYYCDGEKRTDSYLFYKIKKMFNDNPPSYAEREEKISVNAPARERYYSEVTVAWLKEWIISRQTSIW